jgi:hypothetical protein
MARAGAGVRLEKPIAARRLIRKTLQPDSLSLEFVRNQQ